MSIKKMITLLMFCFVFTCGYCSYTYATIQHGGKQETALNKKIDTKDLSGINLWVADLYNNDRVLYAIVVTLVMAILGTVMAWGTDLVLRHFGMSVSKISHSE
jgi:ABC-type phosphate/phosphonate transport system permease subunit